MLASTIAPAGAAGALPLFDPDVVGVGAGAGVGAGVGAVGVLEDDGDVVPVEELEEDDDPEGLDDPAANWVVVVPGDELMALPPPHPVTASEVTASVPTAQSPFRFNCIMGPFGRWGADVEVTLGKHLLWINPVRVVVGLQKSP